MVRSFSSCFWLIVLQVLLCGSLNCASAQPFAACPNSNFIPPAPWSHPFVYEILSGATGLVTSVAGYESRINDAVVLGPGASFEIPCAHALFANYLNPPFSLMGLLGDPILIPVFSYFTAARGMQEQQFYESAFNNLSGLRSVVSMYGQIVPNYTYLLKGLSSGGIIAFKKNSQVFAMGYDLAGEARVLATSGFASLFSNLPSDYYDQLRDLSHQAFSELDVVFITHKHSDHFDLDGLAGLDQAIAADGRPRYAVGSIETWSELFSLAVGGVNLAIASANLQVFNDSLSLIDLLQNHFIIPNLQTWNSLPNNPDVTFWAEESSHCEGHLQYAIKMAHYTQNHLFATFGDGGDLPTDGVALGNLLNSTPGVLVAVHNRPAFFTPPVYTRQFYTAADLNHVLGPGYAPAIFSTNLPGTGYFFTQGYQYNPSLP